MPFLDVSDVLLDPEFTDTFVVLRRQQVMGDNGRVSIGQTLIPSCIGVFTAAGPNDLERLDDNERIGQFYTLVTKFRLRGPSIDTQDIIDGQPQYQPDLVTWDGNNYIVKSLDEYTRYGAGFIQAIIGSFESIEPAPV